MLRVSLIRLYLRIRSLAVLEVRDGDALTYRRKTHTLHSTTHSSEHGRRKWGPPHILGEVLTFR